MILGFGKRVAESLRYLELGFEMEMSYGHCLSQCCHKKEARKNTLTTDCPIFLVPFFGVRSLNKKLLKDPLNACTCGQKDLR